MNSCWSGFYGPSFRRMLQFADQPDLPDSIWEEVVYLHSANPVNEGHWEFLAFGYLYLFDRDGKLTDKAIRRLKAIRQHFHPRHPTANWRLMSRIVQIRLNDTRLTLRDLQAVNLPLSRHGFLRDIPGDKSTQYHAFLLLLIARFADPGDPGLRPHVENAFRWLISQYLKHGDPSPIGRGRFQIFGYASMVGIAHLAQRWSLVVPKDWHADIWRNLGDESRVGALSPKWDGPFRAHLLHGYNSLDDYPAFADLVTRGAKHSKQMAICIPKDSLRWFPLGDNGSGLIADREMVYACLLSSSPTEQERKMSRALKRVRRWKDAGPDFLNPLEHPASFSTRGINVAAGGAQIEVRLTLPPPRGGNLEMTIWSPKPIRIEAVSGNVEIANQTWRNWLDQTWNGLSIRIVRIGSTSLGINI